MNDRIKNLLGLSIVITVLVFAYAVASYVRSYGRSIQPGTFRSFAVSAEGKIVAVPDVAQFTFSVITQGKIDIAKLQKENTEKVNKAIEFVKSNGVDDKDIKTQNYNLEPRYQHFSCPEDGGKCPPPEIVGYSIHQTVLVKIRDFTKIGPLLSGVIENGANSVSQLSFTIDDPTEVQNKARAEAIEKAKQKAKAIAKAGDFRVGRLLSIEEGGFYPPPYYGYGGESISALSVEKALPAPRIEPGSQDITVNVTLRYEIE